MFIGLRGDGMGIWPPPSNEMGVLTFNPRGAGMLTPTILEVMPTSASEKKLGSLHPPS